jgi:hypothetical protein
MSARVESAVLRLYEDPGLRDELTDDEATPMLKWAEGEVARLDATSADDADFGTATAVLRKLLTAVNRFIGRRAYTTPEEQAAAMDKIAEHATTLGYAMPPERRAAFMQTQATADNLAALTALLAMVDGSAAEMGATTPPSEDAIPATSAPATESNSPSNYWTFTGGAADADAHIDDTKPDEPAPSGDRL